MSLVETIIVIDSAVEDYQSLVSGIVPGTEVFVLDSAEDGVEQITRILKKFPNVAALHIVSHGSPGCLYLGNSQLSLDTLNRYSQQLQSWSAPNLLLYGCNVAAGDAGDEFLEKLHRLTGAAIAASSSPIGHQSLGGNWHLDTQIGTVNASLPIGEESLSSWKGLLQQLLITATSDPVVAPGGLSATYQNVGSVNGTSVDLRGTIISANPSGGLTWTRATNPNDIRLEIDSGSTGRQVTILWEIFEAGTTNPISANTTFTIADLDGVNSNDPIERVSASPNRYTVNTPTNLVVTTVQGVVQAQGSANESSGPTSAINYQWDNVSSWQITYNAIKNGGRFFDIDGNLEYVFSNPVTITVPVANNDNFSTNEDNSFSGNVLADNGNGVDSDPNSNPLTVTAVNGTAVSSGTPTTITLSSGASVTMNADGTFSYNPNNAYQSLAVGQTATEAFQYTISNGAGGGTNTATVNVAIAGVNDSPVNNLQSATGNINEDNPLTFNSANSNQINITDVDAGSSPTVTLTASNGILTLGSTANVTVTGDGTGTVTVSGPLADVNNALDGLVFTPSPNFNGSTSIQIQTNDGNGGTDTDSIAITVNAQPDPPALDLNGSASGQNFSNTVIGSGVAVNIASPTEASGADPDGDEVQTITIALSGVVNGANEILTIGGTAVPLVDGSATGTAGGTTFAIAVSGSTITITRQGGGIIPNADFTALLRGITYQNNTPTPTDGDRVFTFTASDGTATSSSVTSTINVSADTDGDGIINVNDLDDDNDGISDPIEQNGDPNRDTDGDGILDSIDLDSDNDGITDLRESGLSDSQIAAIDPNNDGIINSGFGANGLADAVETTPDSGSLNYNLASSDGDGVPDFQDLDSDGDSLFDALEAGGTDTDNNGEIDNFSDGNANGLGDSVDPSSGGTPLPVLNTDGDGVANYRDLDSDNDGILDSTEQNGDPNRDTDGDGILDSLDLDSDNDGIADIVEAGGSDTNGDGIVDNFSDSNGNGLADSVDPAAAGTALSVPDTDGDGISDFQDLDSDNDGIADVIEAGGIDANGDGVIDNFSDSNRDGIADSVSSATGGTALFLPDTDGDGVRDFRDSDSDNDGIVDLVEAGGIDANGDGILDNLSDSNSDGLADLVDSKTGGTPLSLPDTDGDGVSDFRDSDSDNDGITDVTEAGGIDANGDGIVDNFSDSNGDGLADSVDTTTNGTPLSLPDTDGDGVSDFRDSDSDNDGIVDLVEAGGSDTNGDGIVDNFSDSNGDGLADSVEGTPLLVPDSDGDGVQDFQDSDSDNDGIADIVEAGGIDANGDGVIDNFVDSNGDGLADSVDSTTNGTPLSVPDTDGDGVSDFRDLDSDNDGITDVIEAGGIDANGDGVIDNFVDSNGDGLADSVDTTTNGTPLSAPDTDGDGIRDFRDPDSDGDGQFDLVEAGGVDANNDGRVDNFSDSNGDGLADSVDPATGGVPLNPNLDSDGNGLADRLDNGDFDGDGIPDSADLDDDDDGILDTIEQNGNLTRDTDSDGIPDNFDLDSDNDGIADLVEAGGVDANGDGIVDSFSDSNNNGVADSVEGSPLPAPDTDGDGVRDFQDRDSDNDGIADVVEAGGIDTNGDRILDNFVDSNSDGLADSVDTTTNGTPLSVPDTDGDGVRDFRDRDSDNDGIADLVEAGGSDTNGDGIIDNFTDTNGDGLADNVDPVAVPDTDGDGVSDFQDLDSDNDGIVDTVEAGGTDTNGDGIVDNFVDSNGDGLADSVDSAAGGAAFPVPDTDGDGVQDFQDSDSDNDGIADVVEAGGIDANGDGVIDNFVDSNGDGLADSVDSTTNGTPLSVPDTDGDGVSDFRDLDSDNDGITDVIEAGGIDANGDGVIDNFVDSNGDGLADSVDTTTNGTPLSAPDTDGDGIRDFRDPDSDGDGQFDLVEAGGVDANNDGRVDNFSDSNGDGLADSVDPATGGVPLNSNRDSDSNGLPDRLDNGDRDRDGIPNSADLDDDNDGILNTVEQNGDPTRDTDGDGLPDSFDRDSDNDGIVDLVEAGGSDTNGDGIVDNFSDSNGNGLADSVEGSPLPAPDTDGDGIRDFQDLDSDNDGIVDTVEAGGIDTNGDGIVDNFSDSNRDGIADSLSSATGGTALSVPDTDGDGVRDFRDRDSDNDGIADLVEAGGTDTNGDGIVDNFSDSNGDGLADSVDPTTGGVPLNPNLDSDGNGLADRLDNGDFDGDSIPDSADLDDDDDGILDTVEQNGDPTRDTDGDGLPDSFDLDSDNDGIADLVEAGGTDTNGDGIVDSFSDNNGNGLADSVDPAAGGTAPPVPDSDSDGVKDFQDLDSDNDGIVDLVEAGGTDTNGDGVIDNFRDSNSDGLADSVDTTTNGTPLSAPDTDGDGVSDFRDRDSDNDGITDVTEAGGIDANGDGVIDNLVDSNGDGLADRVNPATGGTPLSAPDTDGDGIPNFQDLDSNGDGIFDITEAGGVDANGDGIIDDFGDSNGDGLADNVDPKTGGTPLPIPDSDGNGIPDYIDSDATAAVQAADDRGRTLSNTPIFLNVLSNDARGLRIASVTNGTNGTVTINDNGTPDDPTDDFLVYTPNPGFTGSDSFSYTARDAQGNEFTASVAVAVRNPSPARDDSIATPPNEPVNIRVLDNDGRGLRISSVTNGANGIVTINDNGTPNDPSDDFLVYTPNPDFQGEDEFTYTAIDALGNPYEAIVSVKVDPNRPNAADDEISTTPGQDLVINVLGNDSDPNRQALRIVSVTQGLRGTVSIDDNGTPDDPSDDRISYAPNNQGESVFSLNRAGNRGLFSIGGNFRPFTDTFSYTVSDPDGNEETATVNVNVAPEARLKFTLTENQADLVSEVGFFKVDDENGTIDGIAPGEAGYVEAALRSGRVIFSSLSGTSQLFGENPTRIMEGFRSDDLLNFFFVQDSTVDATLARIGAGENPDNVFFATADANGDGFNHLEVGEVESAFSLGWEDRGQGGDRDFNDMRLTVEVTDESAPIGSNLQGDGQRELLDLSELTGQTLQAQISIDQNASYDNIVGLYRLEDASGTVRDPLTGTLITPGQQGYTEAALAQSVGQFDEDTTSATVNVEGGVFYAPYILANGSESKAYFPFLASNADGFDHLRLLADNTFGFEDLVNGGDADYNDAVIRVAITPI
jgi:hypothetical protein